MSRESTIREIAEGAISDPQLFLVEVIVTARKGPKKILVIIDGDAGVNIDDCALISRHIADKLETDSLLGDESYNLEVSTPGLDQPLKLNRQYSKNIGRRLKVKMAEGTEEGKLIEVTTETIKLEKGSGSGKKKETTTMEINFSQIEKAFVLVSFK